ncbi:hypothetical protein DFH06DRAFT_1137197 [Mycena polygramma]|nr:hypothetical protein DFH06DRAFT_1137197 [Mycena polygramma]
MDDTLPIDVDMEDDAPSRPGSRSNPFLLPDSPPTLARAKRIIRQIQVRVGELEAQSSRILTPVVNTSSSTAATTAPTAATASVYAPRPRRAILALEASYRENRTAARNLGPAAHIPRGGYPGAASSRALRREEALRLQMSPRLRDIIGFRRLRTEPLTYADLWIGGVGPPEQDAIEGYQKCTICHFAKSHPVSYLCGHSHCYACIRMWLERKWTCPDCVRPMFVAPFRQYAEEAALARAFSNWNDTSVVDYSFESLIFPKEPRVAYPDLD